MQIDHKIPLVHLPIFNDLLKEYIGNPKSLEQLYSFAPTLDGLEQVIQQKEGFKNRSLLKDALLNQFKDLNIGSKTQAHVDLLSDSNTYTVTAAHQLCLFTGPSYFIYKIISAIKLCNLLSEKYPNKNFVPVYWMGSEDHDFEEINHAVVYGKTITWENNESGAIGSRSLNGISESIAQLEEIIGNTDQSKNLLADLKNHFQGKRTYGAAFQAWILDLFKEYGLLVLDQHDPALKDAFKAVMKDELLNESSVNQLKKNEVFLSKKYHNQAKARDLNLFYLKDGLRARIEKNGTSYNVVDTDLSFTQEEVLSELENHPERFSPNVILRPLYQEFILPNVAFIGGPGEVAYWLQLKDVFAHHKIIQPTILLRDMAVTLSKKHIAKLKEWEMDVSLLFNAHDILAKQIVAEESQKELDLHTERASIEKLFSAIKSKAIAVDKNLERSVDSELQKVLNSFQNLEGKLIRAEKKNFEIKLSQLDNIQNKLLPNNTLQERVDSFIPVYLKNNEDYFSNLLESFNPLEQTLKVFAD